MSASPLEYLRHILDETTFIPPPLIHDYFGVDVMDVVVNKIPRLMAEALFASNFVGFGAAQSSTYR
ncbi:MAG: hypothetical protein NTX75_08820 [Proteobacteria bacterium]|nr:hypothetical protein [Pseudomonadota bacterium]